MKPTTVTQKGQVTIPKELREKLGVRRGDKIVFEFKNNEAKLQPVKGFSILELYGSLKSTRKPNLSIHKLIKLEEKAAVQAIAKDF